MLILLTALFSRATAYCEQYLNLGKGYSYTLLVFQNKLVSTYAIRSQGKPHLTWNSKLDAVNFRGHVFSIPTVRAGLRNELEELREKIKGLAFGLEVSLPDKLRSLSTDPLMGGWAKS